MSPDDTPGSQSKPGGGGKKWSREFGPFLTLGLQLSITVVVFFFLGRWLDGMLGTEPWLMLVCLGIGVTGGFIKFFRTAIAIGKESDRESERKTDEH
jgi:F0F1-type ATP synthase assembly protein I